MISHWTGLVQRKGAGIVERMKLNARLDPEVFDRLMFHQSSQKVPVSDVIANALDALEREQKLPETIMEPSKTSRENLPYWPIIWPILSRKLIEAGINGKRD